MARHSRRSGSASGAAGGEVGLGSVVAAFERVRVVGPELRHASLERRLEQRDGLGSTAGGPVGLGEVVTTQKGPSTYRSTTCAIELTTCSHRWSRF